MLKMLVARTRPRISIWPARSLIRSGRCFHWESSLAASRDFHRPTWRRPWSDRRLDLALSAGSLAVSAVRDPRRLAAPIERGALSEPCRLGAAAGCISAGLFYPAVSSPRGSTGWRHGLARDRSGRTNATPRLRRRIGMPNRRDRDVPLKRQSMEGRLFDPAPQISIRPDAFIPYSGKLE